MPRTIEDREYNFLQGRRQVADFVESIWQDPALNMEAKALIKKKYPHLQIPDYDLRQHVDQRFDEDRQARERVEIERKQVEDKKKFDDLRAETQKQYGLTEDGMKDLEKFMVENNVGSYEVAAGYKVYKEPKPMQATYQDQYYHHDKHPQWAEITKDPEGWGRNELLKTLHNEQERARQQRF